MERANGNLNSPKRECKFHAPSSVAFGKLVRSINVAKLFYQLAFINIICCSISATAKEKKISEKFTSSLEWGNSVFACFVFVHFGFSLSTYFRCFVVIFNPRHKQNITFICQQNERFGLTECYQRKKKHYGKKQHG